MRLVRCRRIITVATVTAVGTVGSALAIPAAASAAATVMCGSTITTNTTLTADVGPCLGDGLIIGANNVTLNLNGHRVFGTFVQRPPFPISTAIGQVVGIRFQQVHGSSVKNGENFHFAAGVSIEGGSGNVVKGLSDHDNFGPGFGQCGDGILISDSNKNTVAHNTVARNAPYSGISVLQFSNYNRIIQNTVSDNSFTGEDFSIKIEGPNATHNDIEYNTVTGSGASGIGIQPSCHDVVFLPGTPPNPTCDGDVSNSDTIVRGNVANHNGFSFAQGGSGISVFAGANSHVLQPTREIIEFNVTSGNHVDGIHLQGGVCDDLFRANGLNDPRRCATTHNTLDNNLSVGNGNDGINLGGGSNDNTVRQQG